jgi:hypothetical protein
MRYIAGQAATDYKPPHTEAALAQRSYSVYTGPSRTFGVEPWANTFADPFGRAVFPGVAAASTSGPLDPSCDGNDNPTYCESRLRLVHSGRSTEHNFHGWVAIWLLTSQAFSARACQPIENVAHPARFELTTSAFGGQNSRDQSGRKVGTAPDGDTRQRCELTIYTAMQVV